MLGAGLSYAVTDNWQINGEYIWHSQQKGSEKVFNPRHPARTIRPSDLEAVKTAGFSYLKDFLV